MHDGKQVLCPRCGIPMDYVMESEIVGSEKRLIRYHQCPACRAKLLDEKIVIRANGSKIIVVVDDYTTSGFRPIISSMTGRGNGRKGLARRIGNHKGAGAPRRPVKPASAPSSS
ncbi:TFIIB-type zinc ribbon-containing protein [Stetteria hydrogenophila]